MKLYQVDIMDLESGEIRRTPMYTGWNEYSAALFRTAMCDCNLAGHRERGYTRQTVNGEIVTDEWVWTTDAHEGHAYDYNKVHACDHLMPPRRFRALRAYLGTGDIVELEP